MSSSSDNEEHGSSSSNWEVLSMSAIDELLPPVKNSGSKTVQTEAAAGARGAVPAETSDQKVCSSEAASQLQWVKLGRENEVEEELFLDNKNEDAAAGLKQLNPVSWWKQQSTLLISQARQANALWSLAFAAAAMVGLVILGQRWHHERCQNLHLRSQLCSRDEKINQLVLQVSRMKDVISGRRRVPIMRPSSVYVDHF